MGVVERGGYVWPVIVAAVPPSRLDCGGVGLLGRGAYVGAGFRAYCKKGPKLGLSGLPAAACPGRLALCGALMWCPDVARLCGKLRPCA